MWRGEAGLSAPAEGSGASGSETGASSPGEVFRSVEVLGSARTDVFQPSALVVLREVTHDQVLSDALVQALVAADLVDQIRIGGFPLNLVTEDEPGLLHALHSVS